MMSAVSLALLVASPVWAGEDPMSGGTDSGVVWAGDSINWTESAKDPGVKGHDAPVYKTEKGTYESAEKAVGDTQRKDAGTNKKETVSEYDVGDDYKSTGN